MTIHAGPIYTSKTFLANMILICDENDDIVLALIIVEKNIQKAEKQSPAKFDILYLLMVIDEGVFDDDKKLTLKKFFNKLGNILILTKIQYAIPLVFQKFQQISQPQFDAREGNSISTKMIPLIMEKVFEDPFYQDREFLF